MLDLLKKDKKGLELICELESRGSECCYTCSFDLHEKYCSLITVEEKVCKYQGEYDNNFKFYRCKK